MRAALFNAQCFQHASRLYGTVLYASCLLVEMQIEQHNFIKKQNKQKDTRTVQTLLLKELPLMRCAYLAFAATLYGWVRVQWCHRIPTLAIFCHY